ncbi:hypothetical protein VC83_01618 [Pseudogymnoascus destructans]|uniref:SGNH hydrolase-type esterase domain-containing protein n=1 Tax=Pseudogymnoascus destructans TaxID=655981 RepID=A0A177AJX5_9PEZI|nr:uncharacterized protein VC83_01618 [Pseudogymnoascus destructans]OAF62090.1 hypothetical protein VC83_01618 [Pseudogymnoascus destructans]
MFNSHFLVLAVAFGTAWFFLPVAGSVLPKGQIGESRQDTGNKWMDTWTSMPQLVEPGNLPPLPFTPQSVVFNEATLHQTLHVSIGADRIRLQISNTFGGSDLPITEGAIALPTVIEASPIASLTCNGATSVTIPKGEVAYSDPIDFSVAAESMLTLTLYPAAGQPRNSITGHPGSRTMSWMQEGNQVNATSITGSSVARISWPDLLLARIQTNQLTEIGVDNQAAGGNRVLQGLGPSLISRYKRDAIEKECVKYIMIFEGVNDIRTAGTNQNTRTRLGDKLISAFTQIANGARAAGILIFATITPFSGPGQSYSDPTREVTRQRVNGWFTSSGLFDAVVDFDAVVRDPATPSQLAPEYNGGDYLHPNVAGYQVIADAFPLDIFTAAASKRAV